MIRFLAGLWAKWRIYRVRRAIEQRLRESGSIVELVVVPDKLTLTSINPGREKTATLIQTDVVTGKETSNTVHTFDSDWDGEAYFAFWGQTLAISLHAEGDRPEPQQLDALKSILNHRASIRTAVERAVFGHYCESVLPTDPSDEAGTPLPSIESPKQLAKVVSVPPTLRLEEPCTSADAVPRFTVVFPCKWNYGSVNVGIEDWAVASVWVANVW